MKLRGELGMVMAVRQATALKIVTVGQGIVWLGDEIGGWTHEKPFVRGFRFGRRWEREHS